MADRPQLGDTPAGKTLKPKPKATPPGDSAITNVKKLIKDLATGGAYDKTLPPWQKGIANR